MSIQMRDATNEELDSVDEYIKSISKESGITFFDDIQDNNQIRIDMPSISRGYSQAMCPYCNAIIKNYKDFKYCPMCGKKVKEQTDERKRRT